PKLTSADAHGLEEVFVRHVLIGVFAPLKWNSGLQVGSPPGGPNGQGSSTSARTASPVASARAKASAAPTNRTFHASRRCARLGDILILNPPVTPGRKFTSLARRFKCSCRLLQAKGPVPDPRRGERSPKHQLPASIASAIFSAVINVGKLVLAH